MEGNQQADYTVEVSSLDITLFKLRKKVLKQLNEEIKFKYKFINHTSGYVTYGLLLIIDF